MRDDLPPMKRQARRSVGGRVTDDAIAASETDSSPEEIHRHRRATEVKQEAEKRLV